MCQSVWHGLCLVTLCKRQQMRGILRDSRESSRALAVFIMLHHHHLLPGGTHIPILMLRVFMVLQLSYSYRVVHESYGTILCSVDKAATACPRGPGSFLIAEWCLLWAPIMSLRRRCVWHESIARARVWALGQIPVLYCFRLYATINATSAL